MPELPEAETIARALATSITDAVIESVELGRTDIVHGDAREPASLLVGRTVQAVYRRAKRVELLLDQQPLVVFRLGMSGRLLMATGDEPRAAHTHVVIRFAGMAQELRFVDPRRFGGLWLVSDHPEQRGKRMADAGAEPLEISLKDFRALLNRQRGIKALLLDQSLIAGIGNIYCDESLFGARVHPETPANQLDDKAASALLRSIRNALRHAIAHNGSTLVDYRTPSGEEGGYRRFHRVYQREGHPCSRCGTEIVRKIVAQRSTCFCPVCQRLG